MNHLFHKVKVNSAKVFNLFTLIILCCFSSTEINATHIVGGQINYKCLGHNNYEITLTIRRDCKNGADSVYFDNPAVFGVFTGDNQRAIRVEDEGIFNMVFTKDDTLNEQIDNVCFGKNYEVCVHQSVYKKIIHLPFDERGYIIAYQRCCRNVSLQNIIDPLETGTTYSLNITASDMQVCNSNPVFGNFPPIYACANKNFEFDHSAIDIDGDSLVYSLCRPNLGKTKPNPQGIPDNPPYDSINWRSPYSIDDLLNGNSGGVPLRIDSRTGKLTAVPNTLGQFLVGICVSEYRNGKLLSSTKRDFEMNIVPCGVRPIASFERTTDKCSGLNQSFKNTSTNGTSFEWYFDWPRTQLKSTLENPNIVFPNKGTYEIVFIITDGSCTDTAREIITIIDPGLKADFTYKVNCASGLSIEISDQSKANGTIVSYNYTLNGSIHNLSSNQKNPVFNLTGDDQITIKLTVTDDNGCTATISKNITVKQIDVKLIGNDTTICLGNSIKLVKNPDPRFTYTWSPTTDLDLTIPSNPIASPKTTTTYKVTITDGLCSVELEITVHVRNLVNIKVVGDTTTCDGKIILVASSDSTKQFEWSLNSNFNPILSTKDTLITTIKGNTTVYVRAGNNSQCKIIKAIQLIDHSLNLIYNRELTICALDTFEVEIRNSDPNDQIVIAWDIDPIIIRGGNSLKPIIYCPTPGRYVLRFTARNQFNCILSDSIVITAVTPPDPDFSIEYDCGSLTVKVKTSGNRKLLWDFGDGKGKSTQAMTSYTYEKSGVYKIMLTIDSICIKSAMKEITVAEINISLKDKITACHGMPVKLNEGGNPNYSYNWTPIDGLDDPKSYNPTATVNKTTIYYVDVSDPRFPGCSKKDSIIVFVPDEIGLTVNPDTILCQISKITLTATSNFNNIKYQWCDQEGKPIGAGPVVIVEPKSTTIYVVKAVDTSGCESRDTVHVTLFELKSTLEGPQIICLGDTGMIMVINSSGFSYTYDWEPKEKILGPANGPIIKVSPSVNTTYTVKISNGLGCEWTLSHTILVNDPSKDIFATADPVMIVPGAKTQLTTVQKPGYKYNWAPEQSLSDKTIYNPIAMPNETTTYTVTVTDEAGCTATASVTVMVKTCEESVFIPNAFSPNGDSHNASFMVRGNFITKMELFIYNRWGQEVFRSKQQEPGWDGTYNGDRLGPDVFGYYVKFQCFDNMEYHKKGNVTIVK